MFPIYKIYFRINCPFDSLGTLPPQFSEIRCAIYPGKAPIFGPPSICDNSNKIGLQKCDLCTAALYQMFQQGRISLNFDAAHPVQTLPVPIRPSLEQLSKPERPSPQ